MIIIREKNYRDSSKKWKNKIGTENSNFNLKILKIDFDKCVLGKIISWAF